MLNRTADKGDYNEKRIMMACRAIGDKLLTLAGDQNSRVMPVWHNGKGSFVLEFQSEFSFNPDSLVKVAQESLSTTDLSQNYVVSVLNCAFNQVVYGFEINTQLDNIPCLGRDIPTGCYTIDIHFKDYNQPQLASLPYSTLLWSVLGFSLVLFIVQPFIQRSPLSKSGEKVAKPIKLGRYRFDQKRRLLLDRKEEIALTEKEYQILNILISAPNQIISRDRLLKEIWEDDGVFTGRSLDMFVSKLRKKIKDDPTVKITNVYGKGYRLEIDN